MTSKGFIVKTRKKVSRAVYRYGMISPGDHVMAALSGGKDSAVMLEALVYHRRLVPGSFRITAVHVALKELRRHQAHGLDDFCESLNVPLVQIEACLSDEEAPDRSPSCFRCFFVRRKEIFNLAKSMGCNKAAFGHHMDDILETLLINMVYHGEFSTMPPRLVMFGGTLELIRPLALLSAHEVQRYADTLGLPYSPLLCPYEGNVRKDTIRPVLDELLKSHRLARHNLYRSMSRINREYLPAG
ncbi:MAG: tRNA 2-thiocytidine(32) synthetase TtcA [Bacteroidales bacterium]|nr:tRNA 2-thiocytidine(32) synthetase TtcA [Bacteroidales bacterium]